ncbi:hypothetical protein IWZ00DRAFT_489802 [Phyllosticta capitalensis]
MASASSLPDEIIIRVAECLIAPNQYAIPYQKLYWEDDKWPNLRMREFADKMAPGISPNHLSPSPVALAVFRPSLLAEFAKLLHKTAVFYFEDSDELFKYLERPGISQHSLEVRRTMRFVRLMEWGSTEGVVRRSPPFCLERRCNLWSTCSERCIGFTPCLDCRLSVLPDLEIIHLDKYYSSTLSGWYIGWSIYPDLDFKIEFRRLVCSMWPLFERAQNLRTVFFAGPGKFGWWTLAPPTGFIEEAETPREFHAIVMRVLGQIINEIERFPRKFPRVNDNKEEDVWEE